MNSLSWENIMKKQNKLEHSPDKSEIGELNVSSIPP